MNLTRDKRNELDALSKEVLGTTSRWKKLLEAGYSELLTEKKMETVPGVEGAPSYEKEVDVPLLRADGAAQYVSKQHTIESIENMLRKAKVQKDALNAAMEAQKVEAKAKADKEMMQQHLQDNLGGSAI